MTARKPQMTRSGLRPTGRLPALVLLLVLFPLAGWTRMVDITVLHTTDVHGHLWPTTDYDGRPDVGGFLRCASKIESIRAERSNVLLIDCGDTFQGSPESFMTRGRLSVEGLNLLDYDAWILGNHEFDWGTAVLREQHDRARMPFLAGNVYFLPDVSNWLPRIQPFIVREVDGLRIAIVGLTTPGIPRWSRPYLLDGAMFTRSVEALEKIMPAVKEQAPDIIIVAVHQGYKRRGDDFANEVQAIARAFPEIDLLLGAHSHEPVEQMMMGDVLFTQAGYHGIWIGQVDLAYDTVQGKLVDRKARLHLMDASVPFHPGLLEEWGDELAAASNTLFEVIGYLPEELTATPSAKAVSPMQQFICRAIAKAVPTDFVLHGALADGSVPAGPVTYRDVWKIVPYENTIGVLSLTPAEIREVLEEALARSPSAMSLGPYGFDFDLERVEGRPVISNLRDSGGQPLHARKRYRVAFNSYVLASGGERAMRVYALAEMPEARLEMIHRDTRDMVVELIRAETPARVATADPAGELPEMEPAGDAK